MNFVSLKGIRERLTKLVDLILSQYNFDELYILNEAKLQEWCDILHSAISSKSFVRENMRPPQKIINKHFKLSKAQPNGLENLLSVEKEKIIIFKDVNQKVQIESKKIKKYASIVSLNSNSHVISGGCLKNNKKSDEIFFFNSELLDLTSIGHLPEGLSSHGSIAMNGNVYFVGGNKDEGVITRSCSKIDLKNRSVEEIAPLNHPVTSLCLVSWKNQYIYKVGGIGECFGQKNISPYIQRYNENVDQWEIINPYLKGSIQHSKFQHVCTQYWICGQ